MLRLIDARASCPLQPKDIYYYLLAKYESPSLYLACNIFSDMVLEPFSPENALASVAKFKEKVMMLCDRGRPLNDQAILMLFINSLAPLTQQRLIKDIDVLLPSAQTFDAAAEKVIGYHANLTQAPCLEQHALLVAASLSRLRGPRISKCARASATENAARRSILAWSGPPSSTQVSRVDITSPVSTGCAPGLRTGMSALINSVLTSCCWKAPRGVGSVRVRRRLFSMALIQPCLK